MNSLDFIISLAILSMAFSYAFSLLNFYVSWWDPYVMPNFLLSAGSPAYWDVLPMFNERLPGISYMWNRSVIKEEKLDALDHLLSMNATAVKAMFGIEGYKLRIVVRDFYNGVLLYRYWEGGATQDVKYKYKFFAVYNGKLAVVRLVVFK